MMVTKSLLGDLEVVYTDSIVYAAAAYKLNGAFSMQYPHAFDHIYLRNTSFIVTHWSPLLDLA